MFLEKSYEYGVQSGLGFFKGNVIPIETNSKVNQMKVPHIGWSNLIFTNKKIINTPFKTLDENDTFYFNHSFWADIKNEDCIIAKFSFGNFKFNSIIGRDNVWGCQFHPEKSGAFGLKIIKYFIKL